MVRVWWRRLRCLLPGVIGLLLYLLLPLFPAFTETVMMRGVFRVVAFPLEWLLSLLPFSVTEVAVLLAVPTVLTLLILWVVRLCRRPNKRAVLVAGVRFVALCASVGLLVFMLTCGCGFSRRSLGELMELPQRQYSGEELAAVTADLARKASEAAAALPRDSEGGAALTVPLEELLLLGDDAYDNLREQYPFLISGTWRVKGVALSRAWSYTGYTGLYCPWLGEANVNVDIPACDLGHTITHELGHTMGFAKEKECNFLGYLACITSGQPDYVYSGYLLAFVYCSNALYKYDKALWKEANSYCSAAMRRDLGLRNAYWKQFEGEVQDAAQKVNDTFIKVNGVQSGTLSYGEMVELMLRYYDKQGWI